MEITLKMPGQNDTATLGLGSMPGRKRKAIYRMHGCRIDPIAYFASDEDAEWFERFMSDLCDLANKPK